MCILIKFVHNLPGTVQIIDFLLKKFLMQENLYIYLQPSVLQKSKTLTPKQKPPTDTKVSDLKVNPLDQN